MHAGLEQPEGRGRHHDNDVGAVPFSTIFLDVTLRAVRFCTR